MELPKCDTNDDVLQLVRKSGRDYEVIATTVYGLELVCVRAGGAKEPPILITAGSHAGEPAGVQAALSLMDSLETDHAVYIVPMRDPFAWGGFGRCLGLALGQEVTIENHDGAEKCLADRGTVVYREAESSLVISLVGDLIFASVRPPQDPSTRVVLEQRLRKLMSDDQTLASLLIGMRACWPCNETEVEGCGDFDRAFSSFVTPQRVMADLNRQFTFAYPPVEVACVRALVDRLKPGLILDLHEGAGSHFYVFGNVDRERGGDVEIGSAILETVLQRGGELYRLDQLVSVYPQVAGRLTEPVPGLMVGTIEDPGQGASFGSYCERYGPCFTLESGMYKPLVDRVQQIVEGSLAAVSRFEEMHRS